MNDAMARDHYAAYGLLLASEITIPEMQRVAADGRDADLTIVRGDRSGPIGGRRGDGAVRRVAEDTVELTTAGVGRFVLMAGRRVVVHAVPGASDDLVRQYLLGSVLGAALMQRGLVPLHVCALSTPNGVWAFTGDRGAGKSTLAALLNERNGWPIVSDDVAVLSLDGAGPKVRSGVHRLKLCEDAVEALAIGLDRSDARGRRAEKLHLNAPERFADAEQPLAALVALERGPELTLAPLHGVDAFELLLKALYRPELLPYCAPAFEPIALASALVGAGGTRVPMRTLRFVRPWALERMDRCASFLEAQIGRMALTPPS